MVSRSVETSMSRTGGLDGPPRRSSIRPRLRNTSPFRDLAAFVDHERAEERDDDLAGLGEAGRLHADDADVGARLRLALLEHFAARVDGLPFEERIRQAHLVPPEVR